jgi:hypothetical protein
VGVQRIEFGARHAEDQGFEDGNWMEMAADVDHNASRLNALRDIDPAPNAP